MAQLQDTHQQLLAALEPLSDDDLYKPYHHYLPDQPGERDTRTAFRVVYDNTIEHYAEHLAWIDTLLDRTP